MASSLNGTGITFSNGTTLSSAPVTSVATGNGLSGGTITTTGTLVIACPTYNTVGSYAHGNVSSSSAAFPWALNSTYTAAAAGIPSAAGTWRYMGQSAPTQAVTVACNTTYTFWGSFCRTV